MAKKYYWMKLKPTFFNNKEIKKMRKVAGGDTYVIIYLKMQLLSLENEGIIYFDSVEEDFASEIALMLDEDEENVRITVGFLERYGLIEQKSADKFLLTEVPESIGKECDSAQRVRKRRALQCNAKPLQCNAKPLQCNAKPLQCNAKPLQCNGEVTNCNTELEKEIEIEKRDREELEVRVRAQNNYENLIEIENLFNAICLTLTPVKNVTDERIRKIHLIQQQYGEDFNYEDFFNCVEKSDYLTGRNGRWSTGIEKKANFDWIMKLDNVLKILSGMYDNKEDNRNGRHSSFSDEDLEFIKKLGTNL